MTSDSHRLTTDLTAGSPWRRILIFALPLMLGGACQQVYTMTDAAVVGRVLGVNALSGLGACDVLVWLIGAVIGTYTQGFSIRMSNAFGAGDSPLFYRSAFTAAWLSTVTGLILCPVMELFAPWILRWMQVQPEIWDYALVYLRIIYAGIPFLTLYHYFSGVLRSVGNSRAPLCAMLISSGLNIVLDIILVVYLHKGISGAAFATIISQGVSAAYSGWCARRLMPDDRSNLRFDASIVRSMLRLSVPMSLQVIISASGGLVIQAVANTYPIPYIAGYTATNKLYGLLEFAAVAYEYAIATYTGQNYGAGKMRRIRDGVCAGEGLSLATALVFSLLIFTRGRSMVSLFLSGDAIDVATALDVGYRFLRLMGIGMPMLYTAHLTRACLQGLGRTGFVTLSSVLELLGRLSAISVFKQLIGNDCILYAEIFAWSSGAIIMSATLFVYLRKLKFKEAQ